MSTKISQPVSFKVDVATAYKLIERFEDLVEDGSMNVLFDFNETGYKAAERFFDSFYADRPHDNEACIEELELKICEGGYRPGQSVEFQRFSNDRFFNNRIIDHFRLEEEHFDVQVIVDPADASEDVAQYIACLKH